MIIDSHRNRNMGDSRREIVPHLVFLVELERHSPMVHQHPPSRVTCHDRDLSSSALGLGSFAGSDTGAGVGAPPMINIRSRV